MSEPPIDLKPYLGPLATAVASVITILIAIYNNRVRRKDDAEKARIDNEEKERERLSRSGIDLQIRISQTDSPEGGQASQALIGSQSDQTKQNRRLTFQWLLTLAAITLAFLSFFGFIGTRHDLKQRAIGNEIAYKTGVFELPPVGDRLSGETLLKEELEEWQAELSSLASKLDEKGKADLRALRYLAEGNISAADTAAGEAIKLSDLSRFTALMVQGRIYFSQAKLDSAIESYRDALEIDPNSLSALRHLTIALIHVGRPQEALSPGELAIEKIRQEYGAVSIYMASAQVNLAGAYINLAKRASSKEQRSLFLQRARQYCLEASKATKKLKAEVAQAQVSIIGAEIYILEGKYENALALLETAIPSLKEIGIYSFDYINAQVTQLVALALRDEIRTTKVPSVELLILAKNVSNKLEIFAESKSVSPWLLLRAYTTLLGIYVDLDKSREISKCATKAATVLDQFPDMYESALRTNPSVAEILAYAAESAAVRKDFSASKRYALNLLGEVRSSYSFNPNGARSRLALAEALFAEGNKSDARFLVREVLRNIPAAALRRPVGVRAQQLLKRFE